MLPWPIQAYQNLSTPAAPTYKNIYVWLWAWWALVLKYACHSGSCILILTYNFFSHIPNKYQHIINLFYFFIKNGKPAAAEQGQCSGNNETRSLRAKFFKKRPNWSLWALHSAWKGFYNHFILKLKGKCDLQRWLIWLYPKTCLTIKLMRYFDRISTTYFLLKISIKNNVKRWTFWK